MDQLATFRRWIGALIVTGLLFTLSGVGEKFLGSWFRQMEDSGATLSLEEQLERSLGTIPGVNSAKVAMDANQAIVALQLSLAATRDDALWAREEAYRRTRSIRPELEGFVVRTTHFFKPDSTFRNY